MRNEYNPDGKDIRFIDSRYKDLFRIPDGGCVQIHYPDETVIKPCQFIDEYLLSYTHNIGPKGTNNGKIICGRRRHALPHLHHPCKLTDHNNCERRKRAFILP